MTGTRVAAPLAVEWALEPTAADREGQLLMDGLLK